MGRAPCCEKVGLRKGRWSAEEDEKLLNYIAAKGEGSWRSLPQNAGLLRCGKSCRLRWINYLRADLKRGNITKEEDELITKLHATLGSRWSLIAGRLPGRTDNEIKNYWKSHLRRRVHSFRKIGSENEIVTLVLDKVPGKGKRPRGGRTSRSAMKKNSTHVPTKTKRDWHERMDLECSPQHSEERSNVTNIDSSNLLPVNNEDLRPVSPLGGVLLGPDELFGAGEEGGRGGARLEAEQQVVDWDLEGIEAKLWDEHGEVWSWLWDDDDSKLRNVQVQESTTDHEGGYGQLESFASWLLSDAM